MTVEQVTALAGPPSHPVGPPSDPAGRVGYWDRPDAALVVWFDADGRAETVFAWPPPRPGPLGRVRAWAGW
jgi:hypothetical protein